MAVPSPVDKPVSSSWLELLLVFFRLGLTSFGGPVAHLGYFRAEFVQRRQWLSERSYADLVALCQFLPGPASSQVGLALGLLRGGWGGALAAWLGFTLPSALVLALLGLGFSSARGAWLGAGLVHGLKVVAVAVVAQAVWGMARSLCATPGRAVLMLVACAVTLWQPGVAGQLAVMGCAGLVGWRAWGWANQVAAAEPGDDWALPRGLTARSGSTLLGLCAVLLALLPLVLLWWPGRALAAFDAFYRAGALVFGGGHVVLPLLQSAVVVPGWVSADTFLAGYGAAQAVPGPLFTFAAFLGAAMAPDWAGAGLALVCLLGIFLPAFLLVAGALPLWVRLRQRPWARGALAGVNAAVVGLLLAALIDPVGRSALHGVADVAVAVAAFAALVWGRMPPWAVVLACGAGGALLPEKLLF
jgi:chromate transporter